MLAQGPDDGEPLGIAGCEGIYSRTSCLRDGFPAKQIDEALTHIYAYEQTKS
jgi:hypothetical protein